MRGLSGTRRIPLGEYLAEKKVSMLLYLYLQQISRKREGESHRYIYGSDVNITNISKILRMSRTTVLTKLNMLEHYGLLKREEFLNQYNFKEDYYTLPIIGDKYVIVNLSMSFVKEILLENNELLLRLYLFHKSYNDTHSRREYCATLDHISKCVGASSTNLSKIISCNSKLVEIGVITVDKRATREKGVTKYINVYKYSKAN